jgi:L-cysteine:1D-myo-inositol 2-amino-2-deoxy-alpha-D-glucopyranoside ligase
VLDAVRGRLADDLDTPGVLGAVDRWATATLTRGGRDAGAPGLVRDIADALLGVRL